MRALTYTHNSTYTTHLNMRIDGIDCADDTTIYFNLEDFDFQYTEKHINAELENVNTWLNG